MSLDSLLLLLGLVQQHWCKLVIAHAVDSAVGISDNQRRIYLRHLLGDQAVLARARSIALQFEGRGGLFLLAVHRGLEASRLTGKAQQHIEIEIYLIQPLPLFECAL